MKITIPSVLICLSILSASSNAGELLGLRFEAILWNATTQGDIQSDDIVNGDETISATRFSPHNMGVEDESHQGFAITFDHELPFVPKLRYTQLSIENSASSVTSRDINYSDVTIPSGSNSTSLFDFGFNELSAFYPIVEGWLNIDVGVNMRTFEGEITLQAPDTSATPDDPDTPTDPDAPADDSSNLTASSDFNERYFLLQTDASIRIPETNYLFAATHAYRNSGDALISDLETKISLQNRSRTISYQFDVGYKRMKLMADDLGGLDAEIKIAGPFLRVSVGF